MVPAHGGTGDGGAGDGGTGDGGTGDGGTGDPTEPVEPLAGLADFRRIDIRVGTVVKAERFPEARKPALKLVIDFGSGIGHRTSSAQITRHYEPDLLVGRQVCAVVNFAPRRIGPFVSEVLTLGFPDGDGEVILAVPAGSVPDGGRLF